MATFYPPAGVTGPAWTTGAVKAQIDVVAANLGVPTQLAEAQAQIESGFNPYARGDYAGGQPTSFGVYQLHHGGELDSLPGSYSQQIAAAYDPQTNAAVSLRRVAAVMAANPGADPGWIAAEAQRPANKTAYAAAVDRAMGNPTSSGGTGSSAGSAQTVANNPNPNNANPFGSGTTTYQFTPIGPSLTIWSWPRIGFAVLGGLLVLLGIYVTFRDSGAASSLTIRSSGGDAGETTTARTSSRPGRRPPARRAAERTAAAAAE